MIKIIVIITIDNETRIILSLTKKSK